MKIVHFITSIDRTSGGIGFYMHLLSKELGKLVELHVVTTKSDNELALENCKLHYIPTGIKSSTKHTWCKILNDIKPDLVHINGCWNPQCAFTQIWAQKLGYRVILTPHGMLEPWIIKRNYWIKKLPALLLYQGKAITKATLIHATALSERENLLKLGYNNNITIVPNGVEVKTIEIKESWQKTKKILFLSRVHEKKGIEFLIESASILKNELNGYKFIIAGEGDEYYIEQLKQRAENTGVGNMFDFCGGVYGDVKWKLFKQADFFILPTYSENFGIVVAEALSSGVPVITTTGTPWIELNINNCGWCVECEQNAITEAIRKALNTSTQELNEMGERGRKLMEQNYSIDSIAKQVKDMYESILQGK